MQQTHTFELVVSGALDDGTVDALHEAGCGDATFAGGDDGRPIAASFHRPAANLMAAVLAAIRDVDKVPGLRVVRVEPDELVWAAEIAERSGRTRESVRLLIAGKRGPGDFPEPVVLGPSPLWRWSEVRDWLARWEKKGTAAAPDERAAIVAAVNGIIEARHSAASLKPAMRKRLVDLLAG